MKTTTQRINNLLGLLVAFALLAAHFPHESLWYDETTSAYLATHSWHTLWEWTTHLDIHPPLYFGSLKLWASVAGSSEFSLRVLSLLLGYLCLAGMFRLGYQITKSQWGAWVALFALLFSGGFLYAAAEVRGYILGLTASTFSLVFLVHSAKPREHILSGIFALLALYTHYAAIFLLPVEFLYVLLRERRISRHLLYFAIPVLGFLPWWFFATLPDGLSYEGTVSVRTSLEAYWHYFLYGQTLPTETASQLAMVLIVGLITYMVANARKQPTVGLLLMLMPMVGLITLILMGNAKLSGRHGWLMWLGVPLIMAAASDKRWLALSWLGIAAYTSLILPLPDQYPSDLRAAFNTINREAVEGDVLLLRDGTLFTAAEYYQVTIPYIGFPADPLTDVNHQLTFHEAAALIKDTPVTQNIWVLSWQGEIMEPQELTYGLAEYAGGTPEETLDFGDVALARYQMERDVNTLFDHIVALPGLLKVPPDGPSLLGVDVYADQRGAGCPVIVHSWWWRGEVDYPNSRVSYRLTDTNGRAYAQLDRSLSGEGYPQQKWEPFVPVLGRGLLYFSADVAEVQVLVVLYDSQGSKPEQSIIAATLTLDQAPCSGDFEQP